MTQLSTCSRGKCCTHNASASICIEPTLATGISFACTIRIKSSQNPACCLTTSPPSSNPPRTHWARTSTGLLTNLPCCMPWSRPTCAPSRRPPPRKGTARSGEQMSPAYSQHWVAHPQVDGGDSTEGRERSQGLRQSHLQPHLGQVPAAGYPQRARGMPRGSQQNHFASGLQTALQPLRWFQHDPGGPFPAAAAATSADDANRLPNQARVLAQGGGDEGQWWLRRGLRRAHQALSNGLLFPTVPVLHRGRSLCPPRRY
ncbi:uncharacterized protein ACA1_015590 [Acanthamoeba castellanii str. Neff]|uniref:Uncharacterized protein n=1 Tax=Acanthamoeba castellanii (strain ATCC 30010 / Neff) TaxID=1257118 RepID=L8H2W0_ACACF|nr:uncharacterized protein ACA1_015590 [Acanthamoeba castellanii str. Neff]ELR18736.1 hypothetical protein ACA1_015590 [Acanthamoeba castellanii str. Neff]